jgi:hypothetical protein
MAGTRRFLFVIGLVVVVASTPLPAEAKLAAMAALGFLALTSTRRGTTS